jgi:stringent starvation protein B
MTSSRPYLLRAMYEWIMDNQMTPYVLVDAEQKGVTVPRQQVQDGKIVLNSLSSAVRQLEMGNEWISFSARFSGSSFTVYIPIQAVLAIYAKENGQGMAFQPEEPGEESPPPEAPPPEKKRPVLKRVK